MGMFSKQQQGVYRNYIAVENVGTSANTFESMTLTIDWVKFVKSGQIQFVISV